MTEIPKEFVDCLNKILRKGRVKVLTTDDDPVQEKCAQVLQDMINHEFKVGRGIDFLMKEV